VTFKQEKAERATEAHQLFQ